MNTNGNKNGNAKDKDTGNIETTELLTEEAEKLIRYVLETPLKTDEQLSELGKVYDD